MGYMGHQGDKGCQGDHPVRGRRNFTKMSKYTLELRKIHESQNMQVFDFDYNFYDPRAKDAFEEKFINHYYDYEIGFETITKFKQKLRSKLNENYPMYKQLYETELRCKDIDFMLNKDLVESITRDLERADENISHSNNTSNGSTSVTGTDGSDFKESSINNGNSTVNFNDLTTINKTDNTFTNSTETKNSSEGGNKSEGKGNEKETTTLKSQGNIGVTSSAELLEKWRSVLINLDLMIIEDCASLFMQIY